MGRPLLKALGHIHYVHVCRPCLRGLYGFPLKRLQALGLVIPFVEKMQHRFLFHAYLPLFFR